MYVCARIIECLCAFLSTRVPREQWVPQDQRDVLECR